MLLAEHILSMTSPEELFPAGQQECKRVFRELAKTWHPDRCPEDKAKKVFSHISVLYEKALEDLQKGLWDYRAERVVTLDYQDGSTSHLPYFTRRPFELGVSYVSKDSVFYILDDMHGAFADRAVQETKAFNYASPRMRDEHSRYLPQYTSRRLRNGRFLVTTARKPQFISLRTVLEKCNGELHSADVMWIMSSFYNICCYLSWSGVVHTDISLDSCFIDPGAHMGALLGSWFYCQKRSSPLKQVTSNAASVLPWTIRKDKVAKPILDLELMKKLGRDLLGKGIDLAPAPFVDWLRTPATEDAILTYGSWRTLVKTKFGQKFHKMSICADDVYF